MYEKAIEDPHYRSEDEMEEDHSDVGRIGEELDDDVDGGNRLERNVGVGESVGEDSEEQDQEPNEARPKFIMDDEEELSKLRHNQDEQIKRNPLNNFDALLEGTADEESGNERNPTIVSRGNSRKIRERLAEE